MFTKVTRYSDYLESGEPVDITDRIPAQMPPETTSEVKKNFTWGSMHAPRSPYLMSTILSLANEKSCQKPLKKYFSRPPPPPPLTQQLSHLPPLTKILNAALQG